MSVRLHRGGKFRGWLGRRLGGDVELGDRAWRRIVHTFGVVVLLYYVVPPGYFVVITTEELVLLILAVLLVMEGCRHLLRWELPMIRPVEERRVASFVYFGVGLVAAVLLFPEPVAVVVVVGTATLDPLIGELRGSPRYARYYPGVPVALYAGMAVTVFAVLTDWSVVEVIVLAAAGALVAIAAEAPNDRWIDDDLAMTIVPGLLLWALVVFWP